MEHRIVLISDNSVMIAPTDDFTKEQGNIGNYLPEEQEEELAKILPHIATEGSAGLDLKAWFLDEELNEDGHFIIAAGETKLVKTGFKWAIPKGYAGLVCSRSGMALKYGVFVLNAPGIIDSDYRGDVGVILHNSGKFSYGISKGDRIAQMMIIKLSDLPVQRVADIDVSETNRGTQGFGSTGRG